MADDTDVPKDLLKAECGLEKERVHPPCVINSVVQDEPQEVLVDATNQVSVEIMSTQTPDTNIHIDKLSAEFYHTTLDQESNHVKTMQPTNINLTVHETLTFNQITEINGNIITDQLLTTITENTEKIIINGDVIAQEIPHSVNDESVLTSSNTHKKPKNVLQILNLARSSNKPVIEAKQKFPERELHSSLGKIYGVEIRAKYRCFGLQIEGWRKADSSEIKTESWRTRRTNTTSSSWRRNDSSATDSYSGVSTRFAHKPTSYVPVSKIQTPIQVPPSVSTDEIRAGNVWRPSILDPQGDNAQSGASWRSRLALKEVENSTQSSFSHGLQYNSAFRQGNSAVYNNHQSNFEKQENREAKLTENNHVAEPESKSLMNTLKTLINASEEKVVSGLQESKNKFPALINQELSQDDFYLVLQLLKKVCNCKTKLKEKSFILSTCCHYKFLDQFVSQIMKVYQLDNSRMNIILENMFIFFETITFLLPCTALDKASSQIKAGLACLKGIKSYSNLDISDETLDKFENLDAHLESLKKVKEDTNIIRESRQELLQQQLPPEDFRHLSVCPTKDDVLLKDKPFLRPNLVSGKYQDTQHYLDVQFRLLREDFLRPLREGIAAYRAHGDTRNTSVRVYKDIEFVPTKLKEMKWTEEDENYWFPRKGRKNGRGRKQKVPPYFGNVVNLNIKQQKYSRLIASKKLLHGSLLCFTKNNFDTVLFATVSSRDEKYEDFQAGNICIEFCHSVMENIFSSPYLMFECDVFFEPYYHVLNVLKSVNPDRFPMAKYLVDMCQDETPPSYLTHLSKISLKGLNNTEVKVKLLDKTSWPSAEELGLNTSQFQALQAGLTQELAVIQGPPGTGKTFIALKIAQTLIENKVSSKPIIVVCLTNHALDQFLLGIENYTEKIVRIGGQSKAKELEKYNMKNLNMDQSTWQQRCSIWVQRLMINYLRSDMVYFESFHADLQKRMHQGIISFDTFQSYEVISYNTRNSLRNDFLEWLVDEIEDFGGVIMGIPQYTDEFIQILENYSGLFNFGYTRDYIYDDIIRMRGSYYIANIANLNQKLEENEKSHCLITLKCIENKIKNLEVQMQREETEENMVHLFAKLEVMREKKIGIVQRLKRRTPATPEELDMWQNVNLWSLTFDQRWKLYWHWVDLLEDAVLENIDHCRYKIKCLKKELDSWEFSGHYDKYQILARKDVIGLTTTGIARLHDKIEKLEPEIVIVEEAAEVLESHIVASLTKSCKHLILIGDHKQLRPSTSVYQLAKQFNFDVSLFERLVRGRGGCITLDVQHRMSPCIANLVTPSIYPQLESHSSTLLLEPVKGITKRLFFVTHSHPEDHEDDESTSHSNEFEANFVVGLCHYTLQQGYSEENVVLLTTYAGQMNLIQQKTKKDAHLKNVRVTVVDNFQGEESDIIILSLVRSNSENSIGFLATENRVCVALSRARNGLYIVGNMKCLTEASDIWTKVHSTLEQQDAIGTALPISCQNHLENGISSASCGEDFARLAPLGGCDKLCLANLACGHPCNRTCHIEPHDTIQCHVLVDKVRSVCNHTNAVQCHQNPDKVPCQSKCEIPMNCEHECSSKCHVSEEKDHVNKYFCMQQCTKMHPTCGHACSRRCGQPCDTCTEQIEFTFKCGHVNKTAECGRIKKLKCMELVDKKLHHCGHIIQDRCGVEMNEYFYKCEEKCTKMIRCGHKCQLKCYEVCTSVKCMEVSTIILACGHQCLVECSKTCGPCQTMITKPLPSCAHMIEQKCGDNSVKVCLEHCTRTLECGHPCKMLCCGEKCKPCSTLVEKIIPDCGHSVRAACSSGVPQRELCTQLCEHILECGHSVRAACSSGVPQRELCTQLCERILECGHKCKQMCAKSCVCNEETTITTADICGHQVNLMCKEIYTGMQISTTNRCVKPCGQKLKCGHTCTGTCASCLQGRLHIPCTQQCSKTLVCGHKCMGPCNVTCPPCEQPCQYKCPHASCSNKCSKPCTPCKKPCPNQCVHTKCYRRCSVKCGVFPCTQPCRKLLKCQHPCMGMCGDPCPTLCSVCQPECVQDLFDEFTPITKQRVVQIPGCGHIVSVKEFDARFNTSQVCVPNCPRCGEIIFLQRYTPDINRHFEALANVKHSFPWSHKQLYKFQANLKNILPDIKSSDDDNIYLKNIATSMKNLQSKLNSSLWSRNQIDLAMKTLSYLYIIWGEITSKPPENPLLCAQSDVMLAFVDKNFGLCGEQQVHDLKLEVARLHRVAQLEELLKVKNQMEAAKLLEIDACLLSGTVNEPTSSFEENITQLSNIVLNYSTCYSLMQDTSAKDLIDLLLNDIQNYKSSCKLIQTLNKHTPLDVTILDVSKGNWHLCPKNHVSFIHNKNDPICSYNDHS